MIRLVRSMVAMVVLAAACSGEASQPAGPASTGPASTVTTALPAGPGPGTSATTAATTAPPPGATTTEPVTTTTAAAATRVVPLDESALEVDWAQPAVVIGDGGEPRVLYQSGPTTAALAVCADPGCSTATLHEVFDAGRDLGWLIGTPLPAGGAYFLVSSGVEGAGDHIRACATDGCAAPAIHQLHSDLHQGTAVAVDPSGAPLELSLYGLGVNPRRFLEQWGAVVRRCVGGEPGLRWCEDTSDWITATFPPEMWIGGGAVGFDGRSDLPVLAISTNAAPIVLRCELPLCPPDAVTEVGPIELPPVLTEGMFGGVDLVVRPDGSPSLVVAGDPRGAVGGSHDDSVGFVMVVTVISCSDPSCPAVSLTDVVETSDSYLEKAVAAGPDGNVWIAWTDDQRLHLGRCLDAMCSEFAASDTGYDAVDVALAFSEDGDPVLAVHSRKRGLELILCGDAACRVEG